MKYVFALIFSAAVALGAESIQSKTGTSTKLDGYFPLYWDAGAGKLYMEIPQLDAEFLYVTSLPSGLGQNDVGLDRGEIRGTRVVRFERVGPKVLLVEPNYNFRASTNDANERKTVAQSFPQSVLWGFKVEGEDPGRVLVDATDFYVRDGAGVVESLTQAKQGSYRFDTSRSALYLAATKNFPKNTEVEVTVTLTSDKAGPLINQVSPDGQVLTLREHHSFIELPGPGYTPRDYDPRAGYFDMSFYDFGTPFTQPVMRRVTPRHRLNRGETLKYYVDPGIPEPLRSAVLEGARWWTQAFTEAGFPNAFQVELLPAGADPMDVRYNVINWVHRSTRGWSMGEAITDPRTGEIIKGQVTLGSLRARQDYMIAEGLLAPYESASATAPEAERMVLARIHQLAAHEVGHTLGLSHNYAASTHNRASVMDYPHPLVELGTNGIPTLGNAYTTGIGDWDKVAIKYGYSTAPAGANEKAYLDDILKQSIAAGLVFLSDEDARPAGSVSPIAHLWDNGPDAVKELTRILDIRRRALDRFGERNIRYGAPLSSLEDTLVPIYLLHRYQTEAVSKLIAGADYRFALRGDGQKQVEMVDAATQRAALDVLMQTIRPEALVLPERLLTLIPPPAHGYSRTREDFARHTGLTFDPLGAAESAANLTVRMILNSERASRLVEQHARDSRIPGLKDVLDRLVKSTWQSPMEPGMPGEVHRVVDSVVLYYLIALAKDEAASSQARAIAASKLDELRRWTATPQTDPSMAAHFTAAGLQIRRFQENPKEFSIPAPVEMPPGQPIGEE